MAKQTTVFVLALVFFAAVMGMASASSDSTAPTSSVEVAEGPSVVIDLPVEGPNAFDNVIGTVSGSATDAASVGGPVPDNAFPDLAPVPPSPNSGVGALQATTVFGIAGVVGAFFF